MLLFGPNVVVFFRRILYLCLRRLTKNGEVSVSVFFLLWLSPNSAF